MKIKNFFKNRNKFIELDTKEFNDLLNKINFLKEHDERASFLLNKDKIVEQKEEFVNYYDGTR